MKVVLPYKVMVVRWFCSHSRSSSPGKLCLANNLSSSLAERLVWGWKIGEILISRLFAHTAFYGKTKSSVWKWAFVESFPACLCKTYCNLPFHIFLALFMSLTEDYIKRFTFANDQETLMLLTNSPPVCLTFVQSQANKDAHLSTPALYFCFWMCVFLGVGVSVCVNHLPSTSASHTSSLSH